MVNKVKFLWWDGCVFWSVDTICPPLVALRKTANKNTTLFHSFKAEARDITKGIWKHCWPANNKKGDNKFDGIPRWFPQECIVNALSESRGWNPRKEGTQRSSITPPGRLAETDPAVGVLRRIMELILRNFIWRMDHGRQLKTRGVKDWGREVKPPSKMAEFPD